MILENNQPGPARWLVAAGLLILAAGNYWMSQMNLEIFRRNARVGPTGGTLR